MKKLLVGLVVFIGMNRVSYASYVGIVEKHWAKNIINKSSIDEYFSPLDRLDYHMLKLDEPIPTSILDSAYSKLFNKYAYDFKLISNLPFMDRMTFSKIIHENLVNNDFSLEVNEQVSFKDIDSLEDGRILSELQKLGIISGGPDGNFRPTAYLSQVESFIIVDKLESLFSYNDNIDFELLGMAKSEENIQYINMSLDGENYIVEFVKYCDSELDLRVSEINQRGSQIVILVEEEKLADISEGYFIKGRISIKKADLRGKGPFNFRIEGTDFPSRM